MKIICKIFGHKWTYYESGKQKFRHCKHCNCMEEYRLRVPVFGNGWYRLRQYTKYGSEKLLNELSMGVK